MMQIVFAPSSFIRALSQPPEPEIVVLWFDNAIARAALVRKKSFTCEVSIKFINLAHAVISSFPRKLDSCPLESCSIKTKHTHTH